MTWPSVAILQIFGLYWQARSCLRSAITGDRLWRLYSSGLCASFYYFLVTPVTFMHRDSALTEESNNYLPSVSACVLSIVGCLYFSWILLSVSGSCVEGKLWRSVDWMNERWFVDYNLWNKCYPFTIPLFAAFVNCMRSIFHLIPLKVKYLHRNFHVYYLEIIDTFFVDTL